MTRVLLIVLVTGISGVVSAAADVPEPAETTVDRTAKAALDRRSLSGPARNTLYSCEFESMGPALDRPWVDEDGTVRLQDKPRVEGSETWDSELDVAVRATERTIKGNGLPGHPTGRYPVDRGSEAFRYDRNPNAIRDYLLRYVIPATPILAKEPSCLPMGIIGVAMSGAVFFNALDADRRDAVANEIFDDCEGHPEVRGRYHYHHGSPCFDRGDPSEHSPLLGYALDGFPIYGPRGNGGQLLANADLDECHGHSEAIERDGHIEDAYHYHVNEEFPYTLGCFRGEVDRSLFERRGRPQRPGPRPRGN